MAASAALPPVLSPLILKFAASQWERERGGQLADPRYREKVYLTDGTLYDHLGLEDAWQRHQTLLISDGDAIAPNQTEPSTDWIKQTVRLIDVIDHQLRQLRQRQVIDAFVTGQKQGAYWSIRSRIERYQLPAPLPVSASRPRSFRRFLPVTPPWNRSRKND